MPLAISPSPIAKTQTVPSQVRPRLDRVDRHRVPEVLVRRVEPLVRRDGQQERADAGRRLHPADAPPPRRQGPPVGREQEDQGDEREPEDPRRVR